MNDRGHKKWTSLMIPEHVQMLDALWSERDDKPSHELVEDEWEQIQQTISEAMLLQEEVYIRYQEHAREYCIHGRIQKVDLLQKRLFLITAETAELSAISLADILAVNN